MDTPPQTSKQFPVVSSTYANAPEKKKRSISPTHESHPESIVRQNLLKRYMICANENEHVQKQGEQSCPIPDH